MSSLNLVLCSEPARGAIHSMERYMQAKLLDYSQLNMPRKITPMDLDFLIDYGGRFLIGEFKRKGSVVPYGQRIALERLLLACGEGSLAFFAEHDQPSNQIIDAASCNTTHLAIGKHPVQWIDDCRTVAELCDDFINLGSLFFNDKIISLYQ